jgi:MoxR-like ATPase
MLEKFLNATFFNYFDEISNKLNTIKGDKSLSQKEKKNKMSNLYMENREFLIQNSTSIKEFTKEFVAKYYLNNNIIKSKIFSQTPYGSQPKEYLWSGISIYAKTSFSFQYSWVFNKDGLEASFCFGSAENNYSKSGNNEQYHDKIIFNTMVQKFINLISIPSNNEIINNLISNEGFVLTEFLSGGQSKYSDIDDFVEYIKNKSAARYGLIKIFSKDIIIKDPVFVEKEIYKYFEIFKPIWVALDDQDYDFINDEEVVELFDENIYSWELRTATPNLIARKKVDLSIFKYGTTIPVDLHKSFEYANDGYHINRGEKRSIKLLIDGASYDASLVNVDRKNVKSDTIQIRYDGNKELKEIIKIKLKNTYNYIYEESTKRGKSKTYIKVPDEFFSYIDFYKTGAPFEYKLVFIDDKRNALEEEIIPKEIVTPNENYTIEKLSDDTGIDQVTLSKWIRALYSKGQAIIYGPPGTGKTYLAQKISKHLVSSTDGIIEIVQFHPAYAYEDFIQGIRPKTTEKDGITYEMTSGRFIDFCNRSKLRKGTCVLIIDEINRANLPRVFGELMYLLEYRESSVPLAGGGILDIPQNVLIIGTMNTADRSIALVDHALRRRFSFISMKPDYNILLKYHKEKTALDISALIEILTKINKDIEDPNYEIGISFFMKEDLAERIEDVWEMEICPYLEEYFFDQPKKVKEYKNVNIKDTIK